MCNSTLFRQGIKANYKVFLGFLALITLYVVVVVYIFDPRMSAVLDQFAQLMPELMAMFGMVGSGTTLIGFMSSYLYGFLLLLFPMVFTIILANQLVVRYVDTGSMTYLLSSPNPRGRIIRTQMLVLLCSIAFTICYVTLLGIAVAEIYFPGQLDIGRFVLLNVGALGLHVAIGGISFLASAACNETRNALLFGAGSLVTFYLLQMVANLGGPMAWAKYLTIFTLFDPDGIVAGNSTAFVMMGALFVLGIVCFTVANRVFIRRDLPV
ncbi:ABC transporter permease [Eubacteriales bacterium OttesenSCG-928-N14]|nr:ABC transporter permease [Eubacteriales bacterium OttesenSCG-928-N14]